MLGAEPFNLDEDPSGRTHELVSRGAEPIKSFVRGISSCLFESFAEGLDLLDDPVIYARTDAAVTALL